VRQGFLAFVGLGCGISPAFFGYFDLSVWGPIALAIVAMALAFMIARPAVPTGVAAVAVAAMLGFAVWCLISIGWAESADRALLEGDRWILSATFLLLAVLAIGDRRDAEIFVAAATAGILCIGAYDLAKMLGDDGSSLFGGTRLLEPLGYINGLGGYFLLGFWPLIALAERSRFPAVAGLAGGGATALLALVLLTESRGTAFAFAVSALATICLFPGRARRGWLLAFVCGGLAIAWGPLTDVTQALPPGQSFPADGVIRHGAEWGLIGAGLVALLWGAVAWVAALATERSEAAAQNLPRAAAALLAVIVGAALLIGVAAVGNPVGRVSDQYNSFTELKPVTEGSRFASGGGNRYDYWRIAWGQFTDHPIDGIGAGNFDTTYFVERRTDEDVRQAHSIELQTLGDTGLIGAILLGTALFAILLGALRRAVVAHREGLEIGLSVAATGMFLIWLAQTSVDWLHLIPGLTGIALGAAAILLRDPGAKGSEGLRRVPLPAVGVAVILAVAAIVLIGRPTLALHLRTEAQAEIVSDPTGAIEKVEESLSLNPDAVEAYYTKAAALARLDAYRPAEAALLEAIAREPHNYVSWGLLGDLRTRRGDIAGAMRAYGRASTLNPRDSGLRVLGSRRGLVEQLHEEPDSAAGLGVSEG
jgi:hypothetical protein